MKCYLNPCELEPVKKFILVTATCEVLLGKSFFREGMQNQIHLRVWVNSWGKIRSTFLIQCLSKQFPQFSFLYHLFMEFVLCMRFHHKCVSATVMACGA